MAPKNESGSSTTLRTNESPSDERLDLAGDIARDDETGPVISSQRADNTDHSDQADTTSLIGVAIMCLLLTLGGSHHSGHTINSADRYYLLSNFSGAVFGLFLKYRAHGLPDLVVRRPSLPSLGLSPKQPGLVSEALPHHAATASLENDNYNYAGPGQLGAVFSVSDESEGSSSPGSGGASPRDRGEDRGRLAQAVDRLRSGLHSTSGFQRF